MSTTRTQRIDAPSTLVRVRSKRQPSCPTGTVVAWSKTNGVTPGKSPRMREISTPPEPPASSVREAQEKGKHDRSPRFPKDRKPDGGLALRPHLGAAFRP